MSDKTTDRVFVSYSSDEAPFVRQVVDELESRGVETWLDEAQLTPGSRWRETVGDALASAKVVIVFLSGKALESPSINFEIGAAVGSRKPVVPVFLTATARRHVPAILSAVAGIDAYALKPEEVAEQIANAVEAA
jgi:TIR domain